MHYHQIHINFSFEWSEIDVLEFSRQKYPNLHNEIKRPLLTSAGLKQPLLASDNL